MIIRESYYTHDSGSDGLPLSVLRIEPDNSADIKGIVQLVHGMNEYKERYIEFMKYLAYKGFVTVIHDNRGHGDSVRNRNDLGYMYSGGYLALIEDIHEITLETKEYVADRTGRDDLPYTLLGHSMGSLAIRCYIKKYDNEIDHLCVLGCPSEKKGTIAGLKIVKVFEKILGERKRSRLINAMVMGSYYRKFREDGIRGAWICSELDVVRKYNDDPLCKFIFTLNGYKNLILLSLMTYADNGYEMKNPGLKIKFFSGSDDPCMISKEGFRNAIRLLRKQGYKNTSNILYKGMRHEILNDRKKYRVYADILKFINS